ncbi:MAG: type II toxin-antitoxin system VapC family toxin [Anaerolineales bacterium]|nr:type II toxin-antitoxin system VapC family toxin [Anaerolineales bacterium]
MKYLLDTHTFLWWNLGDSQLSERARELISDGKNEIFLSAASAWEIAIKTAKGRLVIPEEPAQYLANRMSYYRFHALPVQVSHAVHVYDLPNHHADPFDRLLVAQCQLESLPLITKDENIQKYDLEVIW